MVGTMRVSRWCVSSRTARSRMPDLASRQPGPTNASCTTSLPLPSGPGRRIDTRPSVRSTAIGAASRAGGVHRVQEIVRVSRPGGPLREPQQLHEEPGTDARAHTDRGHQEPEPPLEPCGRITAYVRLRRFRGHEPWLPRSLRSRTCLAPKKRRRRSPCRKTPFAPSRSMPSPRAAAANALRIVHVFANTSAGFTGGGASLLGKIRMEPRKDPRVAC